MKTKNNSQMSRSFKDQTFEEASSDENETSDAALNKSKLEKQVRSVLLSVLDGLVTNPSFQQSAPQPAGPAASPKQTTPEPKESDFEKQLRLRAERFGLNQATPRTTPREQDKKKLRQMETKDKESVSNETEQGITTNANLATDQVVSQESKDLMVSNKKVLVQLATERRPFLSSNFVNVLGRVLSTGNFHERISRDMMEHAKLELGRKYILEEPVLVKMRSEFLTVRAMQKHAKAQQHKDKANSLFQMGEGVTEISAQFEIPSMLCFRFVLEGAGYSKVNIKRIIDGTETLSLSERITTERRLAKLDDSTTYQDPAKQIEAQEFELSIKRFLDSHGVRHRTEKQLRSASKTELTPDFVLDDELYFESKGRRPSRVHFIDAKNFVGGATPWMRKKVTKQLKRYVEVFGFGAVIYSYGVSLDHAQELAQEGILAVDYRWIESA